MLLRHTGKEIVERSALMVNPAKTCQPIGAMYAALGIHNCLPHSHGSQGCCSYHRSTLTRHYKEPVMASTSSFTEGTAVLGGQSNLMQSLETIFAVYNPDIIAVHTTCLSETIGDDLNQIITKARTEGKVPDGKLVIHANTPSYVGSHITGYASMVRAMVNYLSEKSGPTQDCVNLIPGFVEPSDMQEIKRIAREMNVRTILFPDTSQVLNGPQTGSFQMYPSGGSTVQDITNAGNSIGSIALGPLTAGPAAQTLETKCQVPYKIMELPIGLHATDRFVDTLSQVTGVRVPDSLVLERGQLVDVITDMHQYLYGKKVGLVGDPDQLVALTEFLVSLDMQPIHVVTGSSSPQFESQIRQLTQSLGRAINVRAGGDMFLFHQWLKNEPVDLLMGNTYAKYIARDEDIPFIRFGFPILDRVGHSYFPTVGYKGGLRLLEKILDAILDRKDRDASVTSFELVM